MHDVVRLMDSLNGFSAAPVGVFCRSSPLVLPLPFRRPSRTPSCNFARETGSDLVEILFSIHENCPLACSWCTDRPTVAFAVILQGTVPSSSYASARLQKTQ